MPAKRKLMEIAVTRTIRPDGNLYGSTFTLPMSDADTNDAEQCMAQVMKAVNAQFDFGKSNLRLVAYDIEKKQYVAVQFSE